MEPNSGLQNEDGGFRNILSRAMWGEIEVHPEGGSHPSAMPAPPLGESKHTLVNAEDADAE